MFTFMLDYQMCFFDHVVSNELTMTSSKGIFQMLLLAHVRNVPKFAPLAVVATSRLGIQ